LNAQNALNEHDVQPSSRVRHPGRTVYFHENSLVIHSHDHLIQFAL